MRELPNFCLSQLDRMFPVAAVLIPVIPQKSLDPDDAGLRHFSGALPSAEVLPHRFE
jgi:hypothetical protein